MPDPRILHRLVRAGHPRGAHAARRVLGASRPVRRGGGAPPSRWWCASAWAAGLRDRRCASAGGGPCRRARGASSGRSRPPRRRASPTAASASRTASPPRSSGRSIRSARRWSTGSSPTPIARVTHATAGARIVRAILAPRGEVRPGAAGPGARARAGPADPVPQRRAAELHRVDRRTTRRSPRSGPASSRSRRAQGATKREHVPRAEMQDRTLAPRQGGGGPTQPGDLAAVFKDTSLGGRSPDFNSFVKKGDERIRMLEQVDRMPDLQRDFTQSQSKVVFQKSKELRGGLRPDQVSPEKLRELLNEMEQLGRKGGGQQSLERRRSARAWKRSRAGRASRPWTPWSARCTRCARWRKRAATARGFAAAARASGAAASGGTARAGQPAAGRRGRVPRGRGAVSGQGARARRPRAIPPSGCAPIPSTWAWKGESRAGRKEGFDTNLLGRGANVAVAAAVPRRRGAVPQDDGGGHRARAGAARLPGQIKQYFQSLDERSPVPTAVRGQELLSADFLAQLERLALLSRRASAAGCRGERRSPRKGISVEFSDYRPYGMATTSATWTGTSTARLDRLYVKLFVDEEDLCLNLLVDASASMSFGAPSKLDFAARLAAALGLRRPGEPGARGRRRAARAASPRAGARPAGATRCCRSWISCLASGRRAGPR